LGLLEIQFHESLHASAMVSSALHAPHAPGETDAYREAGELTVPHAEREWSCLAQELFDPSADAAWREERGGTHFQLSSFSASTVVAHTSAASPGRRTSTLYGMGCVRRRTSTPQSPLSASSPPRLR
jgi:hypothetical protein